MQLVISYKPLMYLTAAAHISNAKCPNGISRMCSNKIPAFLAKCWANARAQRIFCA